MHLGVIRYLRIVLLLNYKVKGYISKPSIKVLRKLVVDLEEKVSEYLFLVKILSYTEESECKDDKLFS